MRFVDTNIFLRFLINDDPRQADACEALFRRVIEGRERLYTTDMVIAEIVWVLESYYALVKSDVRCKVEKILNTRNLECENKDVIIEALIIYEEKNVDYVDAFNACLLKRKNIREAYSYDRHFDRIEWVDRLEPIQPPDPG